MSSDYASLIPPTALALSMRSVPFPFGANMRLRQMPIGEAVNEAVTESIATGNFLSLHLLT